MKIYAVIDTNVIISAFLSRRKEAATVKIIEAVLSRTIVPMYNSEIITEYYDVLHREKFHIPPNYADSIIQAITEIGLSVGRKHSTINFPDIDDAVFYEIALARDDSFLITGNLKHFPRNCRVVSPAEMIEILNKKSDLQTETAQNHTSQILG